jgi:hypothetical protein
VRSDGRTRGIRHRRILRTGGPCGPAARARRLRLPVAISIPASNVHHCQHLPLADRARALLALKERLSRDLPAALPAAGLPVVRPDFAGILNRL